MVVLIVIDGLEKEKSGLNGIDGWGERKEWSQYRRIERRKRVVFLGLMDGEKAKGGLNCD